MARSRTSAGAIALACTSVWLAGTAVTGCSESSGTPAPIDPTQPTLVPPTPTIDVANLLAVTSTLGEILPGTKVTQINLGRVVE